MTITLQRKKASSSLLERLVERPDLITAVRAMPAPTFAAAIREIGVADAGPLVAAASPEQIVAAFDEDLFVNERPGEREAFDPDRFVSWLEVMLEAGDEAAAARLAELSEDFVLRALASLVRVLDEDALRDRMLAAGEDETEGADAVEKALESSLVQEIDGYLLVSREGKGWDAALAVILALDRDHRALLERLLDRAARQSARLLDDLEALAEVLSDAEALAEDVEAEREERRATLGFVEPRAAKSFLELARQPLASPERDAVTKGYFRALPPAPLVPQEPGHAAAPLPLLGAGAGGSDRPEPVLTALRELHAEAPAVFQQRMEELTYLANVLVAGGTDQAGARLHAADAAQMALATVALGAALAANGEHTVPALRAALEREGADLLFRRASSALAAGGRQVALASDLADAREAMTPRSKLRGQADHLVERPSRGGATRPRR